MTDVIRMRPDTPLLDREARAALLEGRHGDPHQVLGPHAATVRGESGVVIRVMQPDAADCFVVLHGVATAMPMPVRLPLGPGRAVAWCPSSARSCSTGTPR